MFFSSCTSIFDLIAFRLANLQFYLDMKFVISFASQGRYLSRNLNRVVNEIINKALTAFSVTGVDPYRLVKMALDHQVSSIY